MVDFHCHVCGKETDIAPDPPEKAVCEEHCEDHKYMNDSGLPWPTCEHCGAWAPNDYYDGE